MKTFTKMVALFLIGIMTSGCAAAMALHGRPDTNISALRIGQPRAEVLLHINDEPIRTGISEGKRIDVFKCSRGNAPSTGRAIGHAAMDLLTFGWWEVAGVPVEAFQGEKFYLTIKYDENDKVVDFHTSKSEPQ